LSCGSSASTVPIPVSTAQERARQCCTSCRAAAPVIHLPFAVRQRGAAIQAHGDLAAHPRQAARHACKEPMFSSRAAASIRPNCTVIPAARNFSMPCPPPADSGLAPQPPRAPLRLRSRHRHMVACGVMAAWLQRDVGRCTPRHFSRCTQCITSACGSPAVHCQLPPTPVIGFLPATQPSADSGRCHTVRGFARRSAVPSFGCPAGSV